MVVNGGGRLGSGFSGTCSGCTLLFGLIIGGDLLAFRSLLDKPLRKMMREDLERPRNSTTSVVR